MIAVTGATGQLGRLVIEELLKTTPAETLVALARDPAKADDLIAQGVQVRQADYTLPETLAALQSAQTDTDTLMVDQEYRLTLLELGVTPEE